MASSSVLTLVNQALSASANSDAQSLGPYSKNFIAWLDVSANNGSTTVDAEIQHSPDGTNWKTLAAFTNVVNTTATEAVQVTVNAFHKIRSNVVLTGVSASVKVQLWFADDK